MQSINVVPAIVVFLSSTMSQNLSTSCSYFDSCQMNTHIIYNWLKQDFKQNVKSSYSRG